MTDTERLILSLLYTVLEKIDAGGEADSYRQHREVVENGFTTRYSGLNMAICEELSEEIQEEVYQILNMHRALRNSLRELGEDSGIDDKDIRFSGFDGNNESEYLSFGKFLTDDGLYEESPVLNSHMQVIEMYRRQLEVWTSCAKPQTLTKEEIENIIKAKVHPDNR